MMNNWRKEKRLINHLYKKLQKFRYFEDCNFLPCKLTSLERYGWYDGDLQGERLTDGTGSSCSLHHCSPLPLTEKDAFERRDFISTHTWDEYLIKFIYENDEEIESYKELDKIWNFPKAGIDNPIEA